MNTLHRSTLAFALLLMGAPALAQAPPTNTDLAARRELLRRAQDAANAGRHPEALALAQRAGSISMTPSVQAFIGLEHRALGQLAEAMGDAEACIHTIESTPTLPQRETILASCRTLARDLAPLVGHVVVHTPSIDGVRVHIGTVDLNQAFFGLPYLVTPGSIAVDATAPGREPFHQTVAIAAGATVELTVQLRESARAVLGTEHPSDGHVGGSSLEATGGSEGSPNTRMSGTTLVHHAERPVGPILVTGVGVIALGVALVLNLAVADPAFASFNHQYCPGSATMPPTSCPDTSMARQVYNGAAAIDTGTWVTVGVGGALVVGGLLWWALSPAYRTRENVHPVASVSPDGTVVLGLGGAL